MVPAMAVPKVEPRLETLRERPEISPCSASGKPSRSPIPPSVTRKPATISVRCAYRLASRCAAKDETRTPIVARRDRAQQRAAIGVSVTGYDHRIVDRAQGA